MVDVAERLGGKEGKRLRKKGRYGRYRSRDRRYGSRGKLGDWG